MGAYEYLKASRIFPANSALQISAGLFIFLPLTADAKFLTEFETSLDRNYHPVESALNVLPNEYEPIDAAKILSASRPGLYFSVGSERGFIGLALSLATHLLLVDYDVSVVRFNRMNISLLQLSMSQKDYLWLRRDATHSDWKKRIKRLKNQVADPELLSLLRDPENFEFWKTTVNHNETFPTLHGPSERHGHPHDDNGGHAFFNSNYVKDPALYAKVAEVAKRGRIESHHLDLSDKERTSRLFESIKQSGIPISVYDTSNLHSYGDYISKSRFRGLLAHFSRVGTFSTIWLQTYWKPDGFATNWHYAGFKLGQRLGRFKRLTVVLKSLTERTAETKFLFPPRRLYNGFLTVSECKEFLRNIRRGSLISP